MRITCGDAETGAYLDVFLVQCVELVNTSRVQDLELEGDGSVMVDEYFPGEKPTE